MENKRELTFPEKHDVYLPPGFGASPWVPVPQQIGTYECTIAILFNKKQFMQKVQAHINESAETIQKRVAAMAGTIYAAALASE